MDESEYNIKKLTNVLDWLVALIIIFWICYFVFVGIALFSGYWVLPLVIMAFGFIRNKYNKWRGYDQPFRMEWIPLRNYLIRVFTLSTIIALVVTFSGMPIIGVIFYWICFICQVMILVKCLSVRELLKVYADQQYATRIFL